MSGSSEPRRYQTITLIVTLVAAFLARTILINRWPGTNGDEAWYGVNIQEWLAGGTPFLHTGIGNPLNPLHSGPLLAFSLVFEPSAAVLRAPEVLLGMLAVGLAYPLLRRPIGDRPALIATVLLALSPTAVSYARLGWDPSGAPLMTLLAIACAFSNRPLLASIVVGFAWLVHPTNIFVVPIVVAAWAPHGLDLWRAASPPTRARLSRLAIAAAVLAVPFAVWLAIQVARNPQTSLPSISMVIDRITSPSLWVARAWGFVNLLSGVSPLVHIAGPLPGWTALAANIAIAAIALAALVVGWPRLRVHRHAGWLLAGIGFAFAAFHVVAMDEALSPTSERYGVFMLVPMLVAIATAIDALTGRNSLAGRAAALVTAALMAAMLIGGYFVPLWTTGGNAMIAYRTGDTEPKAAAFSFIETDSRGADSIRVVADGWWLYWTLRYLAGADGRIHVDVVPGSNMPGGTHPAGAVVRPFPAPQRTYLVAFEGGAAPSAAASSSASFTARDPAGRPILHVFAVEQPR